jgi:uncharacterized membrane protein HdeD (DUF308 family)
MIGYIHNLDVQIPKDIVQYWGWFLAFGIALVVLGILAIGRAVSATIVSILFFGWLLLIACGIEVAQAIVVGHWAGFFYHLVAAILFGVLGFIFVTRPLLSAEVATMVLGVFFLFGGLFQAISSLWVALPGWGWQFADGIITFILGILIIAQWPVSGLWVIGLFIGIDLIFYGAAWIALALGMHQTS